MEEIMSFEKAKKVIESLSHSQGFYGRLLASIEEFTDEQKADFERVLQEHEVRTDLDLIFLLEC